MITALHNEDCIKRGRNSLRDVERLRRKLTHKKTALKNTLKLNSKVTRNRRNYKTLEDILNRRYSSLQKSLIANLSTAISVKIKLN